MTQWPLRTSIAVSAGPFAFSPPTPRLGEKSGTPAGAVSVCLGRKIAVCRLGDVQHSGIHFPPSSIFRGCGKLRGSPSNLAGIGAPPATGPRESTLNTTKLLPWHQMNFPTPSRKHKGISLTDVASREMVENNTFVGKGQGSAWTLVSASADDHTSMRCPFTPAFRNTVLVAQV